MIEKTIIRFPTSGIDSKVMPQADECWKKLKQVPELNSDVIERDIHIKTNGGGSEIIEYVIADHTEGREDTHLKEYTPTEVDNL